MRKFGQQIINILYQGVREFLSQKYTAYPAQLTLFLFLSMLPLLTLLSELLGVFSLSLESVKEWADLNLTQTGVDRLTAFMVPEKSSLAGNLALLATTLWSASKAQYAICSMADEVMEHADRGKEFFLLSRLRSLIQLIIILGMIVLTLAMLVYAPMLLRLILGNSEAAAVADTVWRKLRWLVVLLVYGATISLVYYMSLWKTMKFREVLPGSIFAAIGFIVVTWFYTAYTRYSMKTNILYGSLSNVVFLLVWMWCISWVFCLGLVLTRAWQKAKGPETGKLQPITVRDAYDGVINLLKRGKKNN